MDKKPVVVINIEGGTVSHVLTSKSIDIVIIDHDTDGVDENQIINDFPGCEDERVMVFRQDPDQIDKKLTNKMIKAL